MRKVSFTFHVLRSNILHMQFSGYINAVTDSASHRAIVSVNLVGPFGRLALVWRQLQVIGHVNAPDHQHPALCFNFAARFGRKPALAGRNLTRFQRAS